MDVFEYGIAANIIKSKIQFIYLKSIYTQYTETIDNTRIVGYYSE